ncbi:unnamed protein product [Cylindrotheca closterium]|uniref:Uncharacterized protein n=1 Tax=Cylindrotheca closterium TaxID=2856 RepID=A0AAD2CYI9_9STRA|nr:unnamed protein product [Cylindrotheca closterium]
MNAAALKAHKLSLDNGRVYKWKNVSAHDDIQAMIAEGYKKPPPKVPTKKKGDPTPPDDDNSKSLPPFICHFKQPASEGGATYLVGDTKKYKNTTWYFCDRPNHRERVKWHTHKATKCCTRLKWKEDNNNTTNDDGTAAAGTETEPTDDSTTTGGGAPSRNLQALLANAMSMVASGNDKLANFLGEAMAAASANN